MDNADRPIRCAAAAPGHFSGLLGLIRVAMHVDALNARSRAIPERLGYHQDGILRAQRRDETDTPRDEVVYSLLRDEWRVRP